MVAYAHIQYSTYQFSEESNDRRAPKSLHIFVANDFWPTIKPFLSKSSQGGSSSTIVLSEDNKIITDQNEVANIFNNHFVNVAKDIGNIDPGCDFSDLPASTLPMRRAKQ